MDIQIAQNLIKEQVSNIKEEWMLRALFRFLGIDDKAAEADSDFVKQYEAKMKPMTKEELIQQALDAEDDYKNGRYLKIEEYMDKTEKKQV